MTAIVPISAKIPPLIARLGSDSEGERLACLCQIDGLLGRAGMSWTDFARIVEAAMREPPASRSGPFATRMQRQETERQILDWLLKDAVGATFSDRELEFLANLRDGWFYWQDNRLRSGKQCKWLRDIFDRIAAESGCYA